MKYILVSFTLLFFSSCAIVDPGEVGVKKTLDKLNEKVYDQGAYLYNPFISSVVKTPTRTVNMEVSLNLQSKEGLNISSVISILWENIYLAFRIKNIFMLMLA